MSTLKAFIEDPTFSRARPATKRARHLSPLEIALDDAARRAQSGEWDGSKGATFVGLYAFCHRRAYGELPGELEQPGEFRIAARAAAEVVHRAFADDGCAMAEFMVWCWSREQRTMLWRRSKNLECSRMGWRLQFSRRFETDYRVARSQRR